MNSSFEFRGLSAYQQIDSIGQIWRVLFPIEWMTVIIGRDLHIVPEKRCNNGINRVIYSKASKTIKGSEQFEQSSRLRL